MTHSILLGLQKEKTMRDVANQSLGLFILLIIVSAFPVFVMLLEVLEVLYYQFLLGCSEIELIEGME